MEAPKASGPHEVRRKEVAMASNLLSNGLHSSRDGLQPGSNGLQPESDGLQPRKNSYLDHGNWGGVLGDVSSRVFLV